jgi:hypothetical protein
VTLSPVLSGSRISARARSGSSEAGRNCVRQMQPASCIAGVMVALVGI